MSSCLVVLLAGVPSERVPPASARTSPSGSAQRKREVAIERDGLAAIAYFMALQLDSRNASAADSRNAPGEV